MEIFCITVPANIEAASQLRCELRRWLFQHHKCSADTEMVVQRIHQEFMNAISKPSPSRLLEVRLHGDPAGVSVELRELPAANEGVEAPPALRAGRLIEQFVAQC